MKKIILVIIVIILSVGGILAFIYLNKPMGHQAGSRQVIVEAAPERGILYYTCGMHPSVNVSPQDYDKGSTKCPICQMDLVPIYAAPEVVVGDGKELREIREKI